ncbi:hypothetical protein ACFQ4C_07120 [Larkinella insperata]|uniref:Uncharacterized protein n=1 Tax=Larkinella insperata TaxID=332158 RepID=A0ABW3Q655_9BACT
MKTYIKNKAIALLLFVLQLNSFISLGQKSTTLDRLNAKHFPTTNVLKIVYNPLDANKRYYKYVPLSPKKVNQDIPTYFSIREKDETLRIVAEFINPLKFSLSLTSKYSDDPNIKIESDFFASLSETVPKSISAPARSIGTAIPKSSELLPEWVLLLEDKHKLDPDYKDYHLEVAQDFNDLEKYLVGNFTLSTGGTQTFEEHIYSAVDNLKASSDGIIFLTNLNKANEVLKELNTVAESTIKAELAQLIMKMSSPKNFNYKPEFNVYTLYSIEKLKKKYNDIMTEKNVLKKSYENLLERMNKIKIVNGEIILTVNDVAFDGEKDLTIDIKAKKFILDDETLAFSDGESHEIQFTIILRRPQVEASGGIAFLAKPVTYNSYNIYVDGTSFKIGNSETKKYVLPALFLNYYRSLGDNSVLILPQIGLGTGKEYPTVFLGAGYVIPNKFIASIGAANAFNQTLKSGYEVNSPIDSSLANDVTNVYVYKWEVRPYISLQLKF